MYHPTTRVLTVLELLQTYGQIGSVELARRLEVTPRSVRRYITMLQDLGIPVQSERGRHGGYRLRPGYKLPPLMLTNNEALAVTLGLLHFHRLGLATDEPAVEGALAKISRVLPDSVQNQVRTVQESTLLDDPLRDERTPSDTIIAFSQAVQSQKRAWIRYVTIGGESSRTIDPYGLILRDGHWYTVGWCHLRNAVRVFRLDRIGKYRILSTTFTRPEGFDTRETITRILDERRDEPAVEILLTTTMQEARQWVSVVSATLEETDDGVLFKCNPGSFEWLTMFLVSLPCPVTVLRPPELMDSLNHFSKRAAAISYTSDRKI